MKPGTFAPAKAAPAREAAGTRGGYATGSPKAEPLTAPGARERATQIHSEDTLLSPDGHQESAAPRVQPSTSLPASPEALFLECLFQKTEPPGFGQSHWLSYGSRGGLPAASARGSLGPGAGARPSETISGLHCLILLPNLLLLPLRPGRLCLAFGGLSSRDAILPDSARRDCSVPTE